MPDAVAEFNPLDGFRQAVLAVGFAPRLPGSKHQLGFHRECGLAAEATFRLGGSVANGGEGALGSVFI